MIKDQGSSYIKKLKKEHNDFCEELNKKAAKHLVEKIGFSKTWVQKTMKQLRKNQKMK
tara:strand:+ start:15709 stop:15882 length:174 start_codon:yes stop_codon:yes gene_type:complete